jgi:putative transposase
VSGPKALTDRSVAERWQEVKSAEQWWGDLHVTMRNTMKTILEASLESELLEQIQAAAYQRNPDRVDYRNGYRSRSLQTRLGVIANLRVPRSRDGTYQSQILPRFGRREATVTDLICDAFLGGLSTRRVGEVLEPLMGEPVSPSTVSTITKRLDGDVQIYHARSLPADIVYFYLDGIVLKVKGVAKIQRKVILAAYGITSQGERVLLVFRQT